MKIRNIVGALAIATSALAIPEGPDPGTPGWTQREATNYARTSEAPDEQSSNSAFQTRWNAQSMANQQEWLARATADPSWVGPPSGNSETTPLSATWGSVATGDPTRYAAAPGPNGQDFYQNEAEVIPVVFYDEGCARISGRVWAPRGWMAGDPTLPGVVIENGSIQAPETLYWWFAQSLVRAGYVAMTFDPRGQGRSDFQTPSGEQGSNANSIVFYTGMVNAIDFFRSSPDVPYPHNVTCAGTYPTVVAPYNPFFDRIDPTRLGIAGHSLGAAGVSAVQGYPGSRFLIPDTGGGNPVDVVIAWDSLRADPTGPPRVPAMGESSEYGLTPHPFDSPPDPESHKDAYRAYRDAGIPVYQFTIQGSTHYEWSLIPTFPTTSWCPDMSTGSCMGGWGNPMAEHYSLAWMDRWLKKAGETGYADADARLLADADWCPRYSFYLRSARAFPNRAGTLETSEDIRADCLATADLHLTQAKLRARSGAPNGSIRVRGDFTTPPALTVPPSLTIRLQDAGSVDVVHTFATCRTSSSGRLRCSDSAANGRFTARFKPRGSTIAFKVSFLRQAISGPFTAPVRATLSHNDGVTRTDTISACSASGSTLRCREP